MAPEAPRAVVGAPLGDTVYLQMTVPDKSYAGRGRSPSITSTSTR
jgi:hypothetical protein